jgi:hypothetical protein
MKMAQERKRFYWFKISYYYTDDFKERILDLLRICERNFFLNYYASTTRSENSCFDKGWK